jgi:hypothetical protein
MCLLYELKLAETWQETDAPESMGFKVNFGNNVYMINILPCEQNTGLFKQPADHI